jgi:hypothetical protein
MGFWRQKMFEVTFEMFHENICSIMGVKNV